MPVTRFALLAAEHDVTAFVVEFDVHRVYGGVLRRYLKRGGKK